MTGLADRLVEGCQSTAKLEGNMERYTPGLTETVSIVVFIGCTVQFIAQFFVQALVVNLAMFTVSWLMITIMAAFLLTFYTEIKKKYSREIRLWVRRHVTAYLGMYGFSYAFLFFGLGEKTY